jgi:DNA-binding transcriptional LysR family regulator
MEQMKHDLDMAVLLTVVDEGGFSAAARAIGQTHSAISKRIRYLEDRLGVQLLVRTTRRMRLTEAGERYVIEAREILARIAALESEISDRSGRLRGRIRLTASNAFGQKHIVPAVVDFMKQNPEVEIDLTLSDAVVDLVRDGFDMAVRSAVLPDSSLVANKLMTNRRVVCAAPDYLARMGTPEAPDDLARHACLRLSLSSAFNEWGLCGRAEQRLRLGKGMSCNSLEAIHAACLAGLGIAWLPMFLVGPDLEAERLTPLLDAHRDPASDSAVSIVRPASEIVSARIRALTDFFVERFRNAVL